MPFAAALILSASLRCAEERGVAQPELLALLFGAQHAFFDRALAFRRLALCSYPAPHPKWSVPNDVSEIMSLYIGTPKWTPKWCIKGRLNGRLNGVFKDA